MIPPENDLAIWLVKPKDGRPFYLIVRDDAEDLGHQLARALGVGMDDPLPKIQLERLPYRVFGRLPS